MDGKEFYEIVNGEMHCKQLEESSKQEENSEKTEDSQKTDENQTENAESPFTENAEQNLS